MKKNLLLSLALGTIFTSFSQESQSLTDCATELFHQKHLKGNPEIALKMIQYEADVKKHQLTALNSTTVYTIPIVVHVMHKGEPIGIGTNVTDADIKAKIKNINEGFRKAPETAGYGNGVDIGIQFALAVTDPSGNPTSGIVRFDMSNFTNYMKAGVNSSKTGGIGDTAIKALSYWDSSTYYNFWIVSEIDDNNGGSGTQGYAYYASSHGKTNDGTILLANTLKSLTNNTATHELGHAFNVRHTFEGDDDGNACPIDDPTQGDLCADTPAHKRSDNDCSVALNSCYPSSTDFSFINNYMSYSDYTCRNMFTSDQKARMITALTTTRQSFLSAKSTEKLTPATAPVADFTPSQPFLVSAGSTVKLYDTSSGVPNNFLSGENWPNMTFDWNLTNGTTSLTDTNQNPKFILTNPGAYSITHTVNNGLGSSSTTGNDIIFVYSPIPVLPPATLISANAGNFGYTINHINFKDIEKTSNSYQINIPYSDFTNTDNTIVTAGETYPLALTVKSGSNYPEYSAVYIDYDNNEWFDETEKVATNTLPKATARTDIMTNITIPTTAVRNTLLRMRVSGNGKYEITNAMINGKESYYAGDTKDFGVYIVDSPGILDIEPFTTQSKLNYYPNPVNNILSFNNTENIDKVEIFNIEGQLLLSEKFQNSSIKIDLTNLKSGTYIGVVYSNDKTSSIKILKN